MKIEKFMGAVKKYINTGDKRDLLDVMDLWNELTNQEKLEAEQLSKKFLSENLNFKALKESGKFTNELAASLFHYGQTLRALALIGDNRALEYEKENFKKLLKSIGYDYDKEGFAISKNDEFGKAVILLLENASKIGEILVNGNDECDQNRLNLHLDALNTFYIEIGLDPIEIGIRAKNLIGISKKELNLNNNETLMN